MNWSLLLALWYGMLLVGIESSTLSSQDDVEVELDQLISEVNHIENEINQLHDLSERSEVQIRHLNSRLNQGSCEAFWEWRCAGSPVCVSFLLMCDGVPDCPDGEDEQHCELPLGNDWQVVFDTVLQPNYYGVSGYSYGVEITISIPDYIRSLPTALFKVHSPTREAGGIVWSFVAMFNYAQGFFYTWAIEHPGSVYATLSPVDGMNEDVFMQRYYLGNWPVPGENQQPVAMFNMKRVNQIKWRN